MLEKEHDAEVVALESKFLWLKLYSLLNDSPVANFRILVCIG